MESKKKFIDTELGALVYLWVLGGTVAVTTTLVSSGVVYLLNR